MVRAHFLGNRRTRTDQAHVAFEHVPELRQLIEREPAQDSADPCDARVGLYLEHWPAHFVEVTDFAEALVRVGDHRAEFVESKRAAVEADALLLEEDRARRRDLDRE